MVENYCVHFITVIVMEEMVVMCFTGAGPVVLDLRGYHLAFLKVTRAASLLNFGATVIAFSSVTACFSCLACAQFVIDQVGPLVELVEN